MNFRQCYDVKYANISSIYLFTYQTYMWGKIKGKQTPAVS